MLDAIEDLTLVFQNTFDKKHIFCLSTDLIVLLIPCDDAA